jgi:hypothetical protein
METFEGFEVMEHAVFIYNNSSDWADVREYLHRSRMLENAPVEYITNVGCAVSQMCETNGYFKELV